MLRGLSLVAVLALATDAVADDHVTLNAGFWLNYTFNLFDETDRDKAGDFGPGNSMVRLGFDAEKHGIVGSFRMRWYSYARMWEYGWVGYRWEREHATQQVELGMTKVPFGILPFASYDYWFDLPYYLGFNNQYDVGAKWNARFVDLVDVQAGFFKNSDIAAAGDLARFSYDLVTVEGVPQARNEETNLFAARAAVRQESAGAWAYEAGGSLQLGQLYNLDTGDMGRQWAAALHATATVAGASVQLQAMQYAMAPKNAPGVLRDVVYVGAFADAFPIAARARVLAANVAYELPIGRLAIDSIKLYNNHSIMLKAEDAFADSQMNIVGMSIVAGPIFAFVDLISARNAPYIGAPTAVAFTTGEPGGEWHSMFNANLGFYVRTDALSWAK